MKSRIFALAAILLMVMSTGICLAQEEDTGDDMEATMRLMGNAEAQLPDAVTKTISLPQTLLDRDEASAAEANSADGMAKANERLLRRENGLSNADEARDRGAEMAEDAKNNRDDRGRSDEAPAPPENPGPPDNPGPP